MAKLQGIKGFDYKRLAQGFGDEPPYSLEQVMDSQNIWHIPDRFLQEIKDQLIQEGWITQEEMDIPRENDMDSEFLDTVNTLLHRYVKRVLSSKYK
jgi:hypothetical protein